MACLLALASSANAQPAPAPAAPTVPATPPPAETLPPAAAEPAPPPPPPPVYTAPPPPPPLVEPPPPAVLVPAAPPPAAEAAPDPLVATAKFKPGKGLDIKSNDGSFALNLRLKGQLQSEIVDSEEETAKLRTHFIVRRLRLAFSGNVFTKDIKYKLEFSFARQELGYNNASISGLNPEARAMEDVAPTTGLVISQAPLLDAYLEFAQLRDATLRVGQAKVAYGRERILGDSDLQTVDRSIDDAEFNFDRDLGVELRSTDFLGLDKLRYFVGIYAAEDRNATLTSSGTGDTGYLYFGRIEILPLGSFEDSPVDFARTSPKLSFGLAYAFVQTDAISSYATTTSIAAVGSPGGRPSKVDYNFQNFTADVLFKASGFSLLGAFHWRKASSLPDDVAARDGIGFVAQAHYLFSKEVPFSIAGNVSAIRKVGDESAIVERTEAGGGLGYYFYDHALKVEAEFEHIWRESGTPKPDNRLRLQLSFIL